MHLNPHARDHQLVGVQAPGGCLDPVLESVPLPALGPQQQAMTRGGFLRWVRASAQHCRRTGGRDSALQRFPGCGHGDRRRDRRIGNAHAPFLRFGQTLTQSICRIPDPQADYESARPGTVPTSRGSPSTPCRPTLLHREYS
jgi:hypothetical protein